MSSFTCSAKHFNSVERTLRTLVQNDQLSSISYKFYKHINPRVNSISISFDQISRLTNDLRELNNICVHLQYSHHYDGNMDTDILETRTEFSKDQSSIVLNLVELYKALSCVRYQIELDQLEGIRELTDSEKESFELLNTLINDIPHYLVSQTDAYNSAKWSID